METTSNTPAVKPTSQLELMLERDAIDKERLRWQRRRDVKLRPEAKALDVELEPLNPDTFKTLKTLERQVNLILEAAYDGKVDRTGEWVTDEAAYKRSQIQLLPDTEGIKSRDKWVRRCLIADQIWHCSEEETLCEKRIDDLNIEIAKLAKPGSTLAEHGILGKKIKRQFEFKPFEMVDYDDFDPDDPYYDIKDAKIDELHEIIDQMSESSQWDAMSNERHLRKKDQALHDLQTLSLLEYIDQLEGLVFEINEDWKANVARLDAEGDLIGKEIEVYFKGTHPKETFGYRCRENLGNTPKWKVTVRDKQGTNKYLVRQNFAPYKDYLMALGKDEVQHIFAFNYLSKKGKAWFDAEKALAVPRWKIRKMSLEELYQYHDDIEKKMSEMKADMKARG